MTAIESMIFDGYYHIPRNERVLINREGRIIDLLLLASLLQVDMDDANYQYPVVNVIGQGTLHIHRLLAETFIPCDMDTTRLTVNHIDGNKRNNTLSNLEWTTRSDNLNHAYVNGLRSDNKSVLCKNVVTGEIKLFYSGADCARHLSVPVDLVRNYIAAKVPYLFDEVYELVYEKDNWRGINISNAIRVKPTDTAIACLKDSTFMVFDSAESAGRFLGLSETRVLRQMYDPNQKPYNGMLFYKRAEVVDRFNDEKFVYVPGSFKDIKPSTKIKPIVVEDLSTGHITEWENATAFAKVVGINRSTIQKAIGKNNGKWNQYRFSYKNDVPSISND